MGSHAMGEDLIKNLPDLQNTRDKRRITLNRVGVSDIDFPIYIRTKNGHSVPVTTKVNLFTSLEYFRRGSHLSRYIEILTRWANKELDSLELKTLLIEIKDTVKAKDSYIEINFKYSLPKTTPVTKLTTYTVYDCAFIGHVNKQNAYKFFLQVKVPVTTLCPCSKAIARSKGAHNQRALVIVSIEYDDLTQSIWIEDIIPLIEVEGSCQIWNLLKRPDEKYVTEYAYDHPKFVEDVTRDTAQALQNLPTIRWFKVKVISYESIHTHQAVSIVERVRKGQTWRKVVESIRYV